MDHNDPSRRQYTPRTYTAQQQIPALAPTSGQYANPGNVERFRQSAYLHDPPTTPQATLRGASEGQQAYGFAQGGQYAAGPVLQPSALQYGQEMQTPESQRQQQPQYPQYASQGVYGMGQPQSAQSPYESVSQYRPRGSTASDTLVASQFAVPQGGQYYLAGQPAQPNTSVPELPTQHLPSQYAQPETYAQPGPSASPYMMDPSQSGQYAYVQQNQYQPQPQPQPQTQPQPLHSADQEFDRYNNQIRTIFTNVNEGSLRDIPGSLLDASNFLLGNAENLGLIRDDVDLYQGRLRLWQEFNRAWLVTLQRQLDMTQDMLRTNQQPRLPYSVISAQNLEQLGNELVRLCDVIEKHGLVDTRWVWRRSRSWSVGFCLRFYTVEFII